MALFTLTDTTLIVHPRGDLSWAGVKPPYTVTLKSADSTRKIEISTDCGTEYFTGNYDSSSATQLVLVIQSAVSHIKATGVAGDVLIIMK